MTQILRQSTQIKVRIGPFVDVTDAVTPETGILLSTADEAELLKANGAATTSLAAATWAAVTGADGWYDLTLTTSHTDTVGTLDVVVHDDSVCLPVFARFQVIEESAYDDIYAAAASGISDILTDTEAVLLDSEAVLVDTEAAVPVLTDTEAILSDTELVLTDTEGAGAIATILTDTEAVLIDAEAILVDTGTTLLADTEAILADTEALGLGSGLTALATGTAQSGAAGTIQLAPASTFADDEMNGNVVKITGGTGVGQARLITDYANATDTATITPNWITNPDATSTYEIVEGSVNLAAVTLTAQTAGDIVADTEAVLTDSEAILTDSEAILADTEALGMGSGLTALATGTAQAGTSTTIQLAGAETFGDDIHNGNVVKITGGTGAGQSRVIIDYIGSTDTAAVTPAWITIPDATSTYEIVDGSANIDTMVLTTQTAGDIIADTEAVLTDSEAILTDAEAIIADTEAVLDDTGNNGVVVASLAAAAIDSIWDEVVESSLTGRQIMRIMLAALAGKLSGAATTTVAIQNVDQTKSRITATVDSSGNRSAVTLDGS
jgi:hypothetical protein